RPASKPRDQAAANTRSRPAPLDQAGRRRRAPRPPLLTACKDRVSFTLRRKPAGRGRRDRPVIGRGQLTPKNDAVCPPFKRQEPRYLMSDPHRDPDGRFQKGGKRGPGRPRRAIESDYLAKLSETVPLSVWQEIVAKAVEDAWEGYHAARGEG